MAAHNKSSTHDNSDTHHTNVTLIAVGESFVEECKNLIQDTFDGIFRKCRQIQEDTTVLSSSNIQLGYYCEIDDQKYKSDPGRLFEEFLKRCRLWCKFCRADKLKVWMSTDMEQAFRPKGRFENVHPGVRLENFSLGSMYDRYTFIEHGKHVSPLPSARVDKRSRMDFEHDSRFLSISYHIQRKSRDGQTRTTAEYRLRVRYDDMQEFVLVNDIEGSSLTVFFMLKTPPSFHKILSKEDPARLTQTPRFAAQVIGNSSVLSVTVASESYMQFQSVVSRLHALRFRVHWTYVEVKPPRPHIPGYVPRFRDDFRMAYALACLRSQGYLITDRADGLYSKLKQLKPSEYDHAEKALQQLALQTESSLEGDRFIDLADQFQQNLEATLVADDTEEEQYDNCRFVRRAIVTPTRCILLPAELMAENRILRQFGEEFCMRIVFRDESFCKLGSYETSKSGEIGQRIVDFLTAGKLIDTRCYQFLACSNSQLRDHGCWLYAQDHDGRQAADVREWMGDFSGIKCVATYVARMGQCFSTSEESVKVSVADGEVEHEEDIKNNTKYIFSDGIGRVSQSLARRVSVSTILIIGVFTLNNGPRRCLTSLKTRHTCVLRYETVPVLDFIHFNTLLIK